MNIDNPESRFSNRKIQKALLLKMCDFGTIFFDRALTVKSHDPTAMPIVEGYQIFITKMIIKGFLKCIPRSLLFGRFAPGTNP